MMPIKRDVEDFALLCPESVPVFVKTSDIASGRPGESSKSAFEPCKYRDAYCSKQDIYDQADGSVFFTEDPAREEYTQCCQIDGNRRKSKRDRNKGADRHEGGEDPA